MVDIAVAVDSLALSFFDRKAKQKFTTEITDSTLGFLDKLNAKAQRCKDKKNFKWVELSLQEGH